MEPVERRRTGVFVFTHAKSACKFRKRGLPPEWVAWMIRQDHPAVQKTWWQVCMLPRLGKHLFSKNPYKSHKRFFSALPLSYPGINRGQDSNLRPLPYDGLYALAVGYGLARFVLPDLSPVSSKQKPAQVAQAVRIPFRHRAQAIKWPWRDSNPQSVSGHSVYSR